MIVCEGELLKGFLEQFKAGDKIYVTLEDALKLGTIGLSINENIYIIDSEFEFIVNDLDKRGA